MGKVRIIIADDQSIIRDGLRLILEMEEDLEVVGLAADGNEAFDMVESFKPDIVLMDIRMPVCDGVMSTKRIMGVYPATRIIILTTFNDDKYIFEALRAGAKGYLLKDVDSDTLADSIRTVMRGGMLIGPEAAERLVMNLGSGSIEQASVKSVNNNAGITSGNEAEYYRSPLSKGKGINNVPLSPRELDIVKLIGKGKTNREIAGELFLSEGTVKNHITNILSKLYLRDRTQIALYAANKGLNHD